jgi:hypothetical protein
VLLRRVVGLDYAEIAARLDKSEGAMQQPGLPGGRVADGAHARG